ncbi:hypothetical protein LSAT2_015587, partial [Lamellibrachia satsuma]
LSHDSHSSLDTQPISQSLLGITRQSLFTGHTTDWQVLEGIPRQSFFTRHTTDWQVLAGYPTTVTLHWTHNRLVSPCWVSYDSHSSLDTQPIGQSLLGIPRQSLFTGNTTDWSV